MPEGRNDTVLEDLHAALASDLLRRVKTGEASAAELTAAIKFLKDNGYSAADLPLTPAAPITNDLPFAEEEKSY